MPQWSPQKYLQFSSERSRPFVDLLSQIATEPEFIVDLGCGPGHLTALMRDRWPTAEILGVDSSPEMIEQATVQNTDPHAHYVLGDIDSWAASRPVDLIISNAAFQWVPTQLSVIPRLREQVSPGGVLAFQVPNNFAAPSHALLRAVASRKPYAAHITGLREAVGVGAETYLTTLADPSWALNVWETTYLHVLPGDDAVFEWTSGTGARPALQALPDELREQFADDYRAELRRAYPKRSFGTVLPFARVFVVATRVPS